MANVFTLLSLPKTSNAFITTKTTVLDFHDGKASPYQKTSRSDTDQSDPTSVSRPKPWNGPLKIQITGDECAQLVH